MRRESSYVKIGLTAFLTVCAILLFYDTLFGRHLLLVFGKRFLNAVQPVTYGAFLAYLLAPIVNFFEQRPRVTPVNKKFKYGRKVSLGTRVFSILLTWIIIGVLLYLLGSVLLPELYKSILQLVQNVETYYYTVTGWVEDLLRTYPQLEQWVGVQMDTYYHSLEEWLTNDLLPQATTLMSALSGRVISVLAFFGDLLVGVIVSVYFLATKELCAAHARKVVYSLFPREKVYWVLRGARKADRIFSGFVRGKLLDSLIIGVLCFLGCTILKFPYTPLVSVVVGVTNIIPFFGPFLGAIPSAFLILLVSPLQCLYFVIFVLALQQLDGNVIGPKILGDKTGLSSLWVILAILVGGSFFGVPGMFFAVPVCACLYSAVHLFVESRLRKKGLPLRTEAYNEGGSHAAMVEPEVQEEEVAEDLPEEPEESEKGLQ